MRTRIGMFCMGMALWASCTQQEMGPVGEEIRLDAAAPLTTRAVYGRESLSAVGTRIGVYGVATTKSEPTEPLGAEWTENPLMANVQTTDIDQATGAMSWVGTYHYPQETGVQVKFCAYHPYAAVGTAGDHYLSTGAGVAPKLHFTLTGKEDVMYADPVIGSRVYPASSLLFNHVLTQLSFQLVNADGMFGAKVTRIAFERVNTRSAMDVETGRLDAWTLPSETFELPGFDGPVAITGTKDNPQKVDRELMLQPGLPWFKLQVLLDNGERRETLIKPAGDEVFEAGKAYQVTLRFSGALEVQASAQVTPWMVGARGENIVE